MSREDVAWLLIVIAGAIALMFIVAEVVTMHP